MKVAVYPGSFDPITNGHLDVVKRGLQVFDKIIVAVLYNPAKKSLFTVDERIDMIEQSVANLPGAEADSFNGLLIDYAEQKQANAVLRGMRAVSDFDYEFQLALMNRRLNRKIQTVFLMTGLRWIYASSSIIKEAASFGGDISGMVPPIVEKKLTEAFAAGRKAESSAD